MQVSVPAHGEVGFRADGARWRLVLTVNALCRIEAEVPDPDELRRLFGGSSEEPPRLSTVRAAFWAGLQDHQPELTLEDAGNLITHLGLERVGVLIGQAIRLAAPPRKAARPRMATWLRKLQRALAGIGIVFSASGSRSA